MTRTAVIAGTGALPALLVAALKTAGDTVLLAEMEGFPATVPDHPAIRFRIERLVPFLDHLVDAGVTRVVLAGAVRRPRMEPELFDARTATLVPRLLTAMQSGDDGALREVISIFEEWDLAVVGAHEILPDLLPPSGVLTGIAPGPQHETDAELGEGMVRVMGRDDSGQACVIRDGKPVLREGPEGTDAMLASLAVPMRDPDDDVPLSGRVFMDFAGSLVSEAAHRLSRLAARSGMRAQPGQTGGILFKAPKPDQDRRADLPVIGPRTALAAAEAQLDGIVIEAGGVMVIDLPEVREILDGQGMFLWVRPRGTQ
jgi:UDP-2,3-diacylglucosamine hydrolase